MAAEAFAYPPIIPVDAQVGSPVALAAVSADMSDHGPLMPNEREPSPSDAPYEFVAAIPSSPQLVRYEGHHHASLDPIPEMGAFEYVYSDGPAPEQFFLCFATARPFETDVIKETVCPPAQTPIAEESDGETDLVTDESDTIALKCGQMQECPWLFKHGQIGAWMSKHRQIVVTYEYTQYDRTPYHTIISVPMNAITLWSYMEKNKMVVPTIGTVCQLPNASKSYGWIREFTVEEREQINLLNAESTVHLFYTFTLCATNMHKSTITYLGDCAVYTFDGMLQNNAPNYVFRLQ